MCAQFARAGAKKEARGRIRGLLRVEGKAMRKKKILLIEDDARRRGELREALARTYDVCEAENADAALALFNGGGGEISLALMDSTLRTADGGALIERLRGRGAAHPIPQVALLRGGESEAEIEALSASVVDFIAPSDIAEIVQHRVENVIRLREISAFVNLVRIDRLTGLYGKEYFYQLMRRTIDRNPDRTYYVVCYNIENFKLVNDVFGMAAGDRLLRGVAEIFEHEARAYDGFCGRLNADQFACLIEDHGEFTDDVFADLSTRIRALPNARGLVMKWGVYPIEDRSQPVERMCDRALLAAMSIRGQYGKYFAFYEDKLRERPLREQEITVNMESALKARQFVVHYQPKYNLRTGKLAGAEALVRWDHPRWGMLSPGEFVPLFERNGFITQLDQYVWDAVCADMHRWDAQGMPPICVSVNVSRADIYNGDPEEVLMRLMEKYALEPSRLHLEITESAYTENPQQIIDMVDRLRRLGFVIEMDDFGSGYSSLNMLNEMPIDILKLDMHFIQSETAKPASQGILQFITSLARWMGLKVTAEGVETKAQLEHLREIGCDYVQGYYFSRPLPCEAFEALIARSPDGVESDGGGQRPEQAQYLLVAEEDAAERAAAREALSEGFGILEAANGAEVEALIQSHRGMIAGIILSLTLPDADCFALLHKLGRTQQLWNIPVVATGPADPAMESRALDAGADDYCVKPCMDKTMEIRVMRALRINVLRRGEKDTRQEAFHDYLTGLLNRPGLDAAVRALRPSDAPLAICLFDLDDTAAYNERYGRTAGDERLVRFADFLRGQLRGSDILAYIGGDEFCVVMTHMQAPDNALKKARSLCEQARAVGDGKDGFGCSCGVVVWNMDSPLQRTVQRARHALYLAKNAGSGECCLYLGEDESEGEAAERSAEG